MEGDFYVGKIKVILPEYNNTLHCLCNYGLEIGFREAGKFF